MKKLTALALALSLAGLTSSLTAWVVLNKYPCTKKTAETQHKTSFLFVLQAHKGTITQTTNGYELTLQNMDKNVLYFSDRPLRTAGFEVLSRFMNGWAKKNNSFQKSPPNAAMIHADLSTNLADIAEALPVELINPTKIAPNSWKFQLHDLNGKLKTGSYKKISLFIDSYSTNGANSTQSQPTGNIQNQWSF